VVLSLAAVNILVALAFQLVSGATVEYGWRAGAAAAGALPLALSFVGRGGFGAVDNASGVATVLEAAAAVASNPAIGVLITDGEELALAGARAWCRDASPAIALNCDGVDDIGRITVMTVPTSGRLVSAFKGVDPGLRVIRLLPGVLTDSVAFADAGWETVTLSRGGLRTLSRIHTSRDTLDNLSGEGIAPTAVVLANAALEVARWSS
jgi:Zn-dependent M28 family amino/carboxypeptidase